jgi:hypothetical protein
MTYQKPEVTVLGDAARLIKGFKPGVPESNGEDLIEVGAEWSED